MHVGTRERRVAMSFSGDAPPCRRTHSVKTAGWPSAASQPRVSPSSSSAASSICMYGANAPPSALSIQPLDAASMPVLLLAIFLPSHPVFPTAGTLARGTRERARAARECGCVGSTHEAHAHARTHAAHFTRPSTERARNTAHRSLADARPTALRTADRSPHEAAFTGSKPPDPRMDSRSNRFGARSGPSQHT